MCSLASLPNSWVVLQICGCDSEGRAERGFCRYCAVTDIALEQSLIIPNSP